MSEMKAKVALVTGASRGIGKAIALELARCGACVVGTSTSADGAGQYEKALSQAGLRGHGFVLDLAHRESIEEFSGSLKEAALLPDILVNNAGITSDGLLLRMSDKQWQEVIDTDLCSVFYLSRFCVRKMLKQKFGRIINVTSIVGMSGNAGQCNYAAAKAGMIGFTRSLALEVAAKGVTVNAIAPGFIETDMTREVSQKMGDGLLSRIPLGRLGRPEDIVGAVSFLASEAASYITGETINISGGLYM